MLLSNFLNNKIIEIFYIIFFHKKFSKSRVHLTLYTFQSMWGMWLPYWTWQFPGLHGLQIWFYLPVLNIYLN